MAESFHYDVFLSYSSKDKAEVRSLAERLREAGVKVWFDEEIVRSGSDFSEQIEKGLEQSRVMVLCMSANASSSDWLKREYNTFSRFRDPLNLERRFIPLRLDDAELPEFLKQFHYIDWRPEQRKQSFPLLLEACRQKEPPTSSPEAQAAQEKLVEQSLDLRRIDAPYHVAWSSDGKRALASEGNDQNLCLWDIDTGRCLRVFKGHSGVIQCIAWSPDGRLALSGALDQTLRLWDIDTGHCLSVIKGFPPHISCIAWSPDGRRALFGTRDYNAHMTLYLWNTSRYLRVFESHSGGCSSVAWSPDSRLALFGIGYTLNLWDVDTGRCLRVFEGHSAYVWSVAWSPDGKLALSGAADKTLRLWDVKTGRCLRVFEGHSDQVYEVAWNPSGRLALSGGVNSSLRLWDVNTGRCLRVLEGHTGSVWSVAWNPSGTHAFSADSSGDLRIWDLSDYVAGKAFAEDVSTTPSPQPEEPVQTEYKSTKVLLVGESGTGKTGLSYRLAKDTWEASDSTVGAWATQWKLNINANQEIWLWDFGGQADQRLIHQLFMNETSVAVLVFDGQKDGLLDTLEQWVHDLTCAASKGFKKLLVAGRVDAGDLRHVSKEAIDSFARAHGFEGGTYLPTSAKKDTNCKELGEAIQRIIPWEELPCITTEKLFKRLKDEIFRLRDQGKVLMDLKHLHEVLQFKMNEQFPLEKLRAVLTSLAGPGMVQVLDFGNWVLLKPEYINAYAQAVIRTIRSDSLGLGRLPEKKILGGELLYESSLSRLEDKKEEEAVLRAMWQKFVEHKLCLKRSTVDGEMLIFPSYCRQDRPANSGRPDALMSFRFKGVLDRVYSSLVVQMYHLEMINKAEELLLWRDAAEFKTTIGKKLGIKLTRLEQPGEGQIDVYFDTKISVGEQATFCKYVEKCLKELRGEKYIIPESNGAIERLRHYVCPNGHWSQSDQRTMKRLDEHRQDKNKPGHNFCFDCGEKITLWDDLEKCFERKDTSQKVDALQQSTEVKLSKESKGRVLVGEVMSTAALADQIAREITVSDYGIDMEIEFRDQDGRPSGERLYLQLKSGDSHLRERADGVEIFHIKKDWHAEYWTKHKYPIMLVIRNSQGQIRWMEISDHLKRERDSGREVTQIQFKGEPFTVASILSRRNKILPP